MKSLPLIVLLVASLGNPLHGQAPKAENPAANAVVPAQAKVQNVTPDEVEKLVKENPKLLILDVRTAEEFEKGHLTGAVNDSFLDEDFAKKLPAVKGRPIVVHCASGGRSTRALEVLKGLDFPVIYHMNGGYKAWVDAGKQVVGKTDGAR